MLLGRKQKGHTNGNLYGKLDIRISDWEGPNIRNYPTGPPETEYSTRPRSPALHAETSWSDVVHDVADVVHRVGPVVQGALKRHVVMAQGGFEASKLRSDWGGRISDYSISD